MQSSVLMSQINVDGVAALLNGEFDRADALLATQHDLVAQTNRALAATLKALISEQTPHVADAVARLDAASCAVAAARAKAAGSSGGLLAWVLGSNTRATAPAAEHDSLELQALAAELSACLCLVHFRTHAYVRGAYVLRQAWTGFAALDADAGALSGAGKSVYLFGAGLFRFFVSLVPASFAWAVKLVGFDAGREAGLALLHQCFDDGGVRSGGALLVIAWIELFFFERLDKAAELIRVARERYPRGPLFRYLEGYLFRKRGMMEAACAAFAACYDASGDVRELQLACLYEQGWCRYLALDTDLAIDLFERFLAEHKSTSFRAFASYQLGTALLLRDERERAAAVFRRTGELVRPHYSFDTFAARKASEFLADKEFGAVERALVLGQIHIDAMRFTDAIDELDKVSARLFHAPKADAALGAVRAGCAEAACVAAWQLGCAYRGKRQLAAARQCLTVAVELDAAVKRERYAVAHSLTELGELALADGQVAEARAFFARVHAVGAFDFDKPLFRRISQSQDVLSALERSGDATPFAPRAPTFVPGQWYDDSAEFKELLALDRLVETVRPQLKGQFSRAKLREHLDAAWPGVGVDKIAGCEDRLVARGFAVAQSDGELLRWAEPLDEHALNAGVAWPLPVRQSAHVIEDWESTVFAVMQFRERDGKLVDLEALHHSDAMRRFRVASLELQTVDLSGVDDRKIVFINLYNAMVLHALVRRHRDSNLGIIERAKFFSRVSFMFADRLTLTLDQIEHGLLRHNRPAPSFLVAKAPFDANDRRLKLCAAFDPRVHFALNCGAVSCPALEFFDRATSHKLLQIATEHFLDETMAVHAADTIECSKILDWYGADFGDSPDEIVRRLVRLAPNAACVPKLNEALARGPIKLKFSSYSWDLYRSRPTKQQVGD
jgi:tetratricopeptide (TPR) repeat protein